MRVTSGTVEVLAAATGERQPLQAMVIHLLGWYTFIGSGQQHYSRLKVSREDSSEGE